MRTLIVFILVFILSSSTSVFSQAGNCLPLSGTTNLAKTPRPLKDMLGINAGYDVERFKTIAPYNSPVPLTDLDSVCSFVRFFYQQNKDYDGNLPKDFSFVGLTRTQLVDQYLYFYDNHDRILQISTAGLKVNVAIEITDNKQFPNKWWAIGDLTSTPSNPSTVQPKGADWANAFLRVYDPKDASGNFQQLEPLVATLELGNEPWGDPGIEAYRYYIRGILDAFKAYYGTNVNNHRIKLAGAAFQAHEVLGTTASYVSGGHLLDYVGTMLGGSELSELRGYLTEGVGVHNYNFDNYCYNDVTTIKKHPEEADGGFSFFKNMSEWVNVNMPTNNKKLNATEFGWNSDDEPSKRFLDPSYSTTIGINYPGCLDDDFGNCSSSNLKKLGIGRTAQAAYLVRSILI